jgi:hypothetical protein
MAYFLHRRVKLVSIRPTEHYGGITSHSVGRIVLPDPSPVALALPTVLWPAPLRRVLETDILIAVAGDIVANLAYVPQTGFRGPTEDELQAEAIIDGLRRLSDSERDRLHALEAATEPFARDEDRAWRVSDAMDRDAPGIHLEWLRGVARSIISGRRFIRAADALAAELLVSEVIGGRRARQIIDQAWYADRPLRTESVAASLEGRRSYEHQDEGRKRKDRASRKTIQPMDGGESDAADLA